MTLLLLATLALGAGVLAIVTAGGRPAVSLVVGLLGSLGVVALALAMPPEESLRIGGVGLVTTPVVRATAVTWAAGLAVLALLEVAVGARLTVVGPSLVGLSVAAVALATRDPATSMAALAAGGVAGVVVPGLSGWLDRADSPARLPTTSRGALAILGSGLLAIFVIAWGASSAGPFGAGALAA